MLLLQFLLFLVLDFGSTNISKFIVSVTLLAGYVCLVNYLFLMYVATYCDGTYIHMDIKYTVLTVWLILVLAIECREYLKGLPDMPDLCGSSSSTSTYHMTTHMPY